MSNNYLKRAEDAINKARALMGGREDSKKLTTKERKRLKDSTFCGPGWSFPVNDCAHYTAALRLLNRSKYSSSTKNKIRACINRRGKKLGCKGAKKTKAWAEANNIDIEALMASDVFKTTRDLVEYSLEHPGEDLPNDCKTCE